VVHQPFASRGGFIHRKKFFQTCRENQDITRKKPHAILKLASVVTPSATVFPAMAPPALVDASHPIHPILQHNVAGSSPETHVRVWFVTKVKAQTLRAVANRSSLEHRALPMDRPVEYRRACDFGILLEIGLNWSGFRDLRRLVMKELVRYLLENLYVDFQGEISLDHVRQHLRGDESKEAKRLLQRLIEDKGVDELLIALADILKDHIKTGINETVLREQLTTYSDS
jgi:hypothetical protein